MRREEANKRTTSAYYFCKYLHHRACQNLYNFSLLLPPPIVCVCVCVCVFISIHYKYTYSIGRSRGTTHTKNTHTSLQLAHNNTYSYIRERVRWKEITSIFLLHSYLLLNSNTTVYQINCIVVDDCRMNTFIMEACRGVQTRSLAELGILTRTVPNFQDWLYG